MLDLSEIYKGNKIKYKNPLILSHKSLKKENFFENKKAIINTNKNFINVNKSNDIILSHNRPSENSYMNTVRYSNLYSNDKSKFYRIYSNTDKLGHSNTDKSLANLKKNCLNPDILIINSSVNNHLKNFLSTKNDTSTENGINESRQKYYDQIKTQNKRNDNQNNILKKKNIYEVMNELKMVNDRKNLRQKVFSERDNKNYNHKRDEFNTSSRAFKQIKNEKYLKFINEINEDNSQKNFFKIINSKKIKSRFVKNYNTINSIDSFNSYELIQKNKNKTNKSEENTKRFYIKPRIKSENSLINKRRNKIKNNRKDINIGNLYSINYEDLKNSIIKDIEMNYKTLKLNTKIERYPNSTNDKQNIIQKQDSICFNGNNDTISNCKSKFQYFSELSSSMKSDGNFSIYKDKLKNELYHNKKKNFFETPNFEKIKKNNIILRIDDNINNSIENIDKSSIYCNSVKTNYNKNGNNSEEFKKHLMRIEIDTKNINNMIFDNNYNNYNTRNTYSNKGNNLLYDKSYNFTNFNTIHLNKNNKYLNKSSNYEKYQNHAINSTFNLYDKKKDMIILDKTVKPLNRNRKNYNLNNNLPNNTIENEKSNTTKIKIIKINYNFNNINRRKRIEELKKFFNKPNKSNEMKIIKTNEEKKPKYKKINKNFNVPNINQIIKKSKQISDKKFKTYKILMENKSLNLKDMKNRELKHDLKDENKNKELSHTIHNIKDEYKKSKTLENNNITDNTIAKEYIPTPDCNDSDFIDYNRLDLELKRNSNICHKINRYNNPQSTANDIVDMYNNKEMNLESNDTSIFKESTNSIFNSKKRSDLNSMNKDLDLSNLSSVFNSRFQYNNEKKNIQKNVNLRFNENNGSNNNSKKIIKNNNYKEKAINRLNKTITQTISNHRKKTKYKKVRNYSDNIKQKKEKKIKKENDSKRLCKEKELKESINDYYSEKRIKIKNKIDINTNTISKYGKVNKKNLVFFYDNEDKDLSKEKLKNNYTNIPGNKLFYSNISLENNIINNDRLSISKKRLNNRSVIPNLYINLYKTRNNTNNQFAIYNSSDNDKEYNLSQSDNKENIQMNKYNNYISNYPKNTEFNNLYSFAQPTYKNLFYFNDSNATNNSNNTEYIKNNRSYNYNNYYLNENPNNIFKNRIDWENSKELNNRTIHKNISELENINQEESKEEEVDEENNEQVNEMQSKSQSQSKEEEKSSMTISLKKNLNKDKYLLELKENGLPDLPKNKILSCNIGSLINISLYNGLPISSNISLITDSFQMFPSSYFVESLIKDSINCHKNNEYFERKVNSYQKYPSIINTKIFFQVMCERPGNITFMFMYKDENDNNRIKFTEPFYILVNPLIDLKSIYNGSNSNLIENDNSKSIIELIQIRMQTVISKNIGKLKNDFENYFEEASLLGYNFIHFKTLQSLSSSENLYSIKDHNALNDSFFDEKIILNQNKKNELFQNDIKKLKQKYSMCAITDVILAQASTESKWILSHTECAYNLENSPWLSVAYELDEILVNYSNLFYNKKVRCNCAPYINNTNDLEEVMTELGNEVYKNNLEEYFMISIQDYLDKFCNYYKNYLLNQDKEDYMIKKTLLLNEIKKEYSLRESNYSKNMNNENNNNNIFNNESIIYEIISQSCKKYGYKRYGVEMPVEFISLILIEKYRIKSKTNELIGDFQFLKEVKNYINLINKEWLEKSKEMIRISLLNVKEFIRYQFIQLNRIGMKRQLIDSYFHIIDKNDPKKILLCNGWIMQSEDNSNYYPDITSYGTWYYFKRKVIIWKDTIKINYGENISKTPDYLIKYMTKYISYLSNIFDGLYIESLANLPIFILKYFIYKARQINPNIIFMTQLPTIEEGINEEYPKTNDLQKYFEKKFTEELGINLFVHELIWDCSNDEIVKNILNNESSNSNITEGKLISKFNSNLYSMSKTRDNKIFFGCYKYLKYHNPFCILYDLTQDNQSYYERYNILAIQSAMMGSIGIIDCAIGSTRGFDQLFLYQVSSQKEKRSYFFDNKKIKKLIKKVINLKNNIQNKEYEEIVFELHISNIVLNNSNFPNKIINQKIDINKINDVKLALSYHNWKPDINMEKINKNFFMAKVKLPIGKHYYKYVIDDNIWICDTSKPMEFDENNNINNILDLNNLNTIKIQDITLLRCFLNSIREKYYHKTSEIFLQKSYDLLCVIRMLSDSKSLINNNLDDKFYNHYYENRTKNLNNYNNIQNKTDYNQLIQYELNPYEGFATITRPMYNIIDDSGGKGEIIIPGKIDSIICSFSTNKDKEYDINNNSDNKYLFGVKGNIIFNNDNNYLNRISTVNYFDSKSIIHFHSFPANSILIIKFSMHEKTMNLIENLNQSIDILFNKGDKLIEKYNLNDISKILFKTEKEEREWSSQKRGTYELKIIDDENTKNDEMKDIKNNLIKFPYSGLHQIMDIIKRIKRKEKQNILFSDDMNINGGDVISVLDEKKFIDSLYYDISENDCLIEYLMERINDINSFSLMREFIKNNILKHYKKLPSYIKPLYFESIIISLYQNIIRISLLNIPFSILNFGDFATALSLCRLEFFGEMSSSSFIHDISKYQNKRKIKNISISKGIPYNTIGSQRMYFRDALIAFKSLFLITNSFKEGKNLLKLIASSLRHGLIPDYFDEGEKPRYNSRDTCWYFINAIKNYIYYSKDYIFLKEEIELIFTSDTNYNEHIQKQIKGEIRKYTLEKIIHIIFQSHAKGIHFQEWDYGSKYYFNKNSYLKKEGYNVDIELDPTTGFIYGGNYYNNGTWMNEFGNSIKNKNKGIPATPRPGADIEIISLVYSCLDFVIEMGNINYFKHKSVILSNGINYPYTQWKLLIKDSFENEFFVDSFNIDLNNNYNNNECNNSKVKRNIYKDYKTKKNMNLNEFQLRPNFLIALYISPKLFTYKNIIKSLNNVELYLLRKENNVVGLKTLDKTDNEYSGYWDNKQNDNLFTSYGFNIYNGIEHTWLYGLYLLLKIKYFNNENNNIQMNKTPEGNEDENQKLIRYASNKLIPVMNLIRNNKWFGLPEMTDELGHVIRYGNQSDIKAMAIFFELLEYISKLDLDFDNSNEYIDNSNEEI